MLYIIATPIGNMEDITIRAVSTLKNVDLILAEDTRKSGLMLKGLGINKPIDSFYDHNEERKTPAVLEELKKGRNIGLISSAGTPTISDPGYKLVRECRRQKLPVTVIPGPCSVVAAVSLSGIAHDKFIFLGYLPRKKNRRLKVLEELKTINAAIIFLESPFRLKESLKDVKEALGERNVSVAREITKKFEEVIELPLSEVIKNFETRTPKGEFIVVVEGKPKADTPGS